VNVLEVIQRCAKAVGIPVPSVAVAATDDTTVQLVELLNQEGRALSARHNWQALTYETSFTTVATESQGSLSTLIGSQTLRAIINDTIWNRTTGLPVFGPVAPKIWQGYKALNLTGPYPEYRIRGNTLRFYPTPTAGQTCYFEYISKSWCTDSTGATYRTNVAADTDLLLLDDEVMVAGLEWRWLRKKGLSYAEEFASYEQMVSQAINRDGTKATLSMDCEPRRMRPGTFVPIGSWNL
jgi:hypothetical protein